MRSIIGLSLMFPRPLIKQDVRYWHTTDMDADAEHVRC